MISDSVDEALTSGTLDSGTFDNASPALDSVDRRNSVVMSSL